jgi:hypothetical protein
MSDGDDEDTERGPRGPESDGRLSAEGDFMLIFGLSAALVTGLYALGGGLPTVLLLGSIASVASLGAVVADLTRPDFRPSTGLHSLITLSSAAGALIAYVYSGALLTATGLGVVALANAGRVVEVDFRDDDSLLDPLADDEEVGENTEEESN